MISISGEELTYLGLSYYLLAMNSTTTLILIDLSENNCKLSALMDEEISDLQTCYFYREEMVYRNKSLLQMKLLGRLAAKLALFHLTKIPVHLHSISYSEDCVTRGKPLSRCGAPVSISHCGEFVIAGASYSTVGVDIAQSKKYGQSALDYAFSLIEKTNAEFCSTALYYESIWTLKESFLKALGIGIYPHIQNVQVIDECEGFNIKSSSPFINHERHQYADRTELTLNVWKGNAVSICRFIE